MVSSPGSIIIFVVVSLLLLLSPGVILADFAAAKAMHDRAEYAESYKVFIKLAQNGDKASQYYVARMHHLGEGRVQNKGVAFDWYKLSANQGFARSQNNLGLLYYERGEIDKAVYWYKKAAKQGLPQAKNNLKSLEQMKKRGILPPKPPENRYIAPPSMELKFYRMRDGLNIN